jgi:hypothetical protein
MRYRCSHQCSRDIVRAGWSVLRRSAPRAPIALFDACAQAGVRKVVQISALGADTDATRTPYMDTKRTADAWLMSSPLDWAVLSPSLVVGMDGDSSRFFRSMASLPALGLPGRGEQLLQPVHIDDLCEAVVRLLASGSPMRCVLDIVGPAQMTYRGMLTTGGAGDTLWHQHCWTLGWGLPHCSFPDDGYGYCSLRWFFSTPGLSAYGCPLSGCIRLARC